MRARANAAASPVRGYIREFVEYSLSRAAPWGRAIDDEWWSVLHFNLGRLPHGPLPPRHPTNGENMKAWD